MTSDQSPLDPAALPARIKYGATGQHRHVQAQQEGQTMRYSSIRASAFPGLLCLVLLAAHPVAADAPASQPAPAGSGPVKALANGTVRFTTPDGWDEIAANATDVRAVYFLHDHASVLSVEVLPVEAKIGPESFGAIARFQRQTRQQHNEKFVENPTVDKDQRFLLRIHEKYHTVVKVDDKSTDKIATQLHLYRQVGARIMMITVWSTADSDDELKQAQSAGEDIALSATFGRPGRKK
jgi:hypothetical protein